jgi:hypothetical protein
LQGSQWTSIAGLASGFGNAFANGGMQALLSGQRPNWGMVAAQSFGQSLGQSLADRSQAKPALASASPSNNPSALPVSQPSAASETRAIMENANGQTNGTGSLKISIESTQQQIQALQQTAQTQTGAIDDVVVTAEAWKPEQYHYFDYLMKSGINMDDERASKIAGNQFDALRFELSQRDANSLSTFGPRPLLQGIWNGGVTAAQGLVEADTLLGGGGFNKAMTRGSVLNAYKWHSDSDLDQAVGTDIGRLTNSLHTFSEQHLGDTITTGLSIAGETAIVAGGLAPIAGFRGTASISEGSLLRGLDSVTNSALVDSEVSALRRIAANNSVDTGSAARMARIDELTTANYNRLLQNDLAGADYVYRAVPENMLDIYRAQGGISGRGGSPTYFSLEGGASPLQQKLGAQLLDEPQVLLRVPTSELVGPAVPRPFGYNSIPQTIGREYFVNSYPQYGAGGFRQLIGTTNSYSDSWIVSPWGGR